MHAWERGQIALSTGVAVTAAAGTILAVLLGNLPLGAALGVTSGFLVAFLMWVWTKSKERK